MRTLKQKKDCIINLLSRYQNEFSEQINDLNLISKDEDFDIYFSELCVLIAKIHNNILSELHFCQNQNKPTQIQNTNIN